VVLFVGFYLNEAFNLASLDLECPLKIPVLKAWSSTCGTVGGVDLWEVGATGRQLHHRGVPLKGYSDPGLLSL
jgi:hypothetical protein